MTKFPTLYQKSDDKIKKWTISVYKLESGASEIVVKYNKDGSKLRTTSRVVDVGKNLGKSNETTPHEQACLDAGSRWQKKLDKGYVKDITDVDKEVLLPMLAHSFQKRWHNIVYPCFTQPKLDGIRCLAKKIDNKTIKYYTREGKSVETLGHLDSELLKMLKKDDIVDGEIYIHGTSFQKTIKLFKKQRPKTVNLKYHLYDIVDTKEHFRNRYHELLERFTKRTYKNIYFVTSNIIQSDKEVQSMHDKYVDMGYEGVILRNIEGFYTLNKRSKDLQKYKNFIDKEFEIVSGFESTGVEAGCVIFNVKIRKTKAFPEQICAVRPKGTFEDRIKWMKDIDNLIGKKLTVRYQGLTDDGSLRFPVGVSIRDYE